MDLSRECFIPDSKVKLYLLKEGTKHYKEFADVGYTSSDGDKLKSDIAADFDYSKAVEKKTRSGIESFIIYMELGVDKKKRFRTVWFKDTPISIPRFITAYRKD